MGCGWPRVSEKEKLLHCVRKPRPIVSCLHRCASSKHTSAYCYKHTLKIVISHDKDCFIQSTDHLANMVCSPQSFRARCKTFVSQNADGLNKES